MQQAVAQQVLDDVLAGQQVVAGDALVGQVACIRGLRSNHKTMTAGASEF